jgi:hypothetical protein
MLHPSGSKRIGQEVLGFNKHAVSETPVEGELQGKWEGARDYYCYYYLYYHHYYYC